MGRGQPKSQNGIFFAAASWGEASLEKVDKIYTREQNFSKQVHFDKIFGILPSCGGHGHPGPLGYEPAVSDVIRLTGDIVSQTDDIVKLSGEVLRQPNR